MSTTTSVSGTTPIVSVASSTSAGAAGGSVIDVSSLVSELVAATQDPQENIISNQTQAVTAQISAVGTLQSALSTFQSSLGALDTPSAFGSETASTTDPTAFTATADSDAVLGNYAVSVSQLAQAQQLVSSAFSAGSSAPIGTGTLQLSLGGTSFTVTVDASDDTVAGLAAAINGATGNPGIEASVVTGTDGAHLVLTSSLTGASNTIQVTETDSGGALSALTYGSGNTANYTQESAPQDAEFSIAGVSYTSASNTVSDALSGVTLSLTGTTTSPATLSVATNTASIESNIDAFVSAYNTLQSSLSSLGSYDSTTGTAGPMMGSALLLGIQSQIQSALYSIVDTGSGTYNTLASIGITTNSDGTLSVNNTTLSTALSSNYSAVSALFSGSAGVATSLNTQITNALATGGPIAETSQTLVQQENSLTQQSNQLQQQMNALSASLTQQYSALNTLLSSLQTTSAYLTQAFDSLPQVQGTPNA
ncbi:MAG TPA: flagellar filament capping protein FliD [Steroidobacteraceae bacterium]|nr:flagellar filament capping protein FliD [Steroidobacteraceae bacterium]